MTVFDTIKMGAAVGSDLLRTRMARGGAGSVARRAKAPSPGVMTPSKPAGYDSVAAFRQSAGRTPEIPQAPATPDLYSMGGSSAGDQMGGAVNLNLSNKRGAPGVSQRRYQGSDGRFTSDPYDTPGSSDPGWKRNNSGKAMEPGPPGLKPVATGGAGSSAANKGFWNTNMPAGAAQNLGMAALGGAAGGASAWASGGDVKTGIGLGAMTGGLGAHYAGAMQDTWKGAQVAGRRMQLQQGAKTRRAGRAAANKLTGSERTAALAANKASGKTSMGDARKAGMAVHNGTSNSWRAASVAGGAGLASGAIFSGHKRKPVNRYNSTRGNYI